MAAFCARVQETEAALAIRCGRSEREPSQILILIVREELAPVLTGLIAGGVVSLWSATLVQSYLYKISAFEPRV
jgi:hypothetical protein